MPTAIAAASSAMRTRSLAVCRIRFMPGVGGRLWREPPTELVLGLVRLGCGEVRGGAGERAVVGEEAARGVAALAEADSELLIALPDDLGDRLNGVTREGEVVRELALEGAGERAVFSLDSADLDRVAGGVGLAGCRERGRAVRYALTNTDSRYSMIGGAFLAEKATSGIQNFVVSGLKPRLRNAR